MVKFKNEYYQTMKTGNLFASLPVDLADETIELLAQKDKVKIERIVSRGHTSPISGWYDQETDEWVLVLAGAAIITFENHSELTLAAGDYVSIPAHTKHKVKWTDPYCETVWLAIHY